MASSSPGQAVWERPEESLLVGVVVVYRVTSIAAAAEEAVLGGSSRSLRLRQEGCNHRSNEFRQFRFFLPPTICLHAVAKPSKFVFPDPPVISQKCKCL